MARKSKSKPSDSVHIALRTTPDGVHHATVTLPDGAVEVLRAYAGPSAESLARRLAAKRCPGAPVVVAG